MTKTNPISHHAGLIGLLAILTLSSMLGCSGGGTTSGEATAAATQAFEAFRTSDWTTYASQLHPMALERFESILRPAFDVMVQVDSAGNVPEEFKWYDSTIKTEDFMNMEPEAFFAYSMTELTKAVPGLSEALEGSTIEVIGEVAEGDSLVHVVVRTQAQALGMGMSEVSVMTTRQSDGEFRLMLPSQIEGLATAVAQGMRGR
jgi:hypothetical protein